MSVAIELSWSQIALAAQAGCMRYILALRNGRRELDGQKEHKWEAHVTGAIAECAVAQWRRLYWDPVWDQLDHSRPDVGEYHVRSTPHGKHLLLHPRDPAEGLYVLVRGEAPRLEIVGTLRGHEGKQERYWGDKKDTGRPCYWVPEGALRAPFEPLE